jgi:hypothetical protein
MWSEQFIRRISRVAEKNKEPVDAEPWLKTDEVLNR